MSDELAFLDATAQADLVRRGEVSPAELVDRAIERIEKLDPQLNAVITPLFEKARKQARDPNLPRGPFRGVPFLLKDLVCQSAGDPYHCGMKVLRERGWISDHDTYLAARFRAAGFVFLGKTNVPELGPIPTTEPEAYGPTRNPWDTARSPLGSSGGSAAAVASGMVPVAHGNDGGGSIRIPASACGLVGLKPSRGRTSLGPDLGESWHGLVAEHVLARSVRDTAAILDAVAGPMPGDPYFAPPPARPFLLEVEAQPRPLRIGFWTEAPNRAVAVHPECKKAAESVATLLGSLGHRVEEAHPRALEEEEFQHHMATVVCCWTARDLDYWSGQLGRKLGPDDVEIYTWLVAERGKGIPASEYIASTQWFEAYSRRVAAWWEEGFDLLLTPTLAEPPPLLGDVKSTKENPDRGLVRGLPFVVFTAPFNVTGQPAISLPLHWTPEGLPVGVQFVAPYAREDLLLAIAGQLEKACPWKDRKPPVHA